jgi:hypothetical protein
MTNAIIILIASLLLLSLLIEISLRLAGVVFPGSFYSNDPDVGWAFRPGSHGWHLGEGKFNIRVNRHGFFDHNHAVEKPKNTFRIAMMGDGYAEATNVAMKDSVGVILQEKLLSNLQKSGKHLSIEIMNFAVSGYGTAQTLLTYKRDVEKYSPDIVLLAFYTGKNIFTNYRQINSASEADITPYFICKEGQLVLQNVFRNTRTFSKRYRFASNLFGNIQNQSRFIQMTMKWVRRFRTKSKSQAPISSASAISAENHDALIYTEPKTQEMKEAWRVTEGILLMMNDAVCKQGAKFYIATLTNRPQVHPDENERKAFMARFGIDTLFYPDMRLTSFAEKAGIPITTLVIPMAAYAKAHNLFLNGGQKEMPFGSGHWNETAHHLAGEILADDIFAKFLQ